ncbi:MAG: DUF4271 domain-containing protein [Bacteroidales bacterium]|nr:DUF4271 domain-containing protein [Bacteroidales bacterium]
MIPAQVELPMQVRQEILPPPLLAAVLFMLALAVLIKSNYGKLLVQDFNIFLQRAYNLNTRFNDRGGIYRNYLFWSDLLFVTAASTFIHLCNMRFHCFPLRSEAAAVTLPLAALGFYLFYVSKHFIARAFGGLMQAGQLFRAYLSYMWLSLRVMGILLVPCILLLPFMPDLWAGRLVTGICILFALLVVIRWTKGYARNVDAGFSIVYYILYLCTFEFIPLLIIWKLCVSES